MNTRTQARHAREAALQQGGGPAHNTGRHKHPHQAFVHNDSGRDHHRQAPPGRRGVKHQTGAAAASDLLAAAQPLTDAAPGASSLDEYSSLLGSLPSELDALHGDKTALKHEPQPPAGFPRAPGPRDGGRGRESGLKHELGPHNYGRASGGLTLRITEAGEDVPHWAVVVGHQIQPYECATPLQKASVLCQSLDYPDEFPTRHFYENGGTKVHIQQHIQLIGAHPDDEYVLKTQICHHSPDTQQHHTPLKPSEMHNKKDGKCLWERFGHDGMDRKGCTLALKGPHHAAPFCFRWNRKTRKEKGGDYDQMCMCYMLFLKGHEADGEQILVVYSNGVEVRTRLRGMNKLGIDNSLERLQKEAKKRMLMNRGTAAAAGAKRSIEAISDPENLPLVRQLRRKINELEQEKAAVLSAMLQQDTDTCAPANNVGHSGGSIPFGNTEAMSSFLASGGF